LGRTIGIIEARYHKSCLLTRRTREESDALRVAFATFGADVVPV
jgi:hypothetical protein